MAEKNKKIRLMPLVVAVLFLVVLYNRDTIKTSLGEFLGSSSQWQDPIAATNPQQSNPSQKDLDKILAAVPDELRRNYFLTYKESGCCKTLSGRVEISVVMISDSVSMWDDDAATALCAAFDGYARDIETEAQTFNTDLSITLHYYKAQLTGDICSGDYSDDWQDPALESAGLPALKQMHSHITEKYQVKEAPVLFAFNKKGRAYATVGNDEFLVLFNDSDFNSFQHELSHIFGAKDFYYPNNVKEMASGYFSDSVMNSGNSADALTAYLIGWTDTLSEPALGFLRDTNAITSESMEVHRKNESLTGYGTKIFGYGTYTGDLIRGRCHGTGTMQYNNGGWYTGQWDNGNWSGEGSGKYIYEDGSSYEGDYKDGKRHGNGTYTYVSGSSYTGNWLNGERNGVGTMYYSNGGWYTGDWENGVRAGIGTGKEVYNNGVYEGAFLDGKRHGQGTYIWSSGDKYTGAWENGTRTGYGTYTWADGTSKSGTWQNSQFVG